MYKTMDIYGSLILILFVRFIVENQEHTSG